VAVAVAVCVALPPSRRRAHAALYLRAVARGPRPLPAVVRGPRRPSDAVARLAAPRSEREDADLAQKQRSPATWFMHKSIWSNIIY